MRVFFKEQTAFCVWRLARVEKYFRTVRESANTPPALRVRDTASVLYVCLSVCAYGRVSRRFRSMWSLQDIFVACCPAAVALFAKPSYMCMACVYLLVGSKDAGHSELPGVDVMKFGDSTPLFTRHRPSHHSQLLLGRPQSVGIPGIRERRRRQDVSVKSFWI